MHSSNGHHPTFRATPIRVVVDDREVGCGTIEALKRFDDVEVVVRRLTLGDYEVDGRILFERKTLIDLVASIKEGRLFDQATRLAYSPTRGVVILEGTGRDLAHCGMRREPIQGALITLSLILGLPVLRSQGPEETARLIRYAARQVRSITSGALPRKIKRPKGKLKAQLQLLQGLPGVGPDRAKRLLEAFGCIEGVLTAAAEELATVPGIGEKTAEAIRDMVAEEAAEYGPQAEEMDV